MKEIFKTKTNKEKSKREFLLWVSGDFTSILGIHVQAGRCGPIIKSESICYCYLLASHSHSGQGPKKNIII